MSGRHHFTREPEQKSTSVGGPVATTAVRSDRSRWYLLSSFFFAAIDAGSTLLGYGGGAVSAVSLGMVTFGVVLPLAAVGVYLRVKEQRALDARWDILEQVDKRYYKVLLQHEKTKIQNMQQQLDNLQDQVLSAKEAYSMLMYCKGIEERLAQFDPKPTDHPDVRLFKDAVRQSSLEERGAFSQAVRDFKKHFQTKLKGADIHYESLKTRVEEDWKNIHTHHERMRSIYTPKETWYEKAWKYALPTLYGLGLVVTVSAMLGASAALLIPWIGIPALVGVGLFAYAYKRSADRYADSQKNMTLLQQLCDTHAKVLVDAEKQSGVHLNPIVSAVRQEAALSQEAIMQKLREAHRDIEILEKRGLFVEPLEGEELPAHRKLKYQAHQAGKNVGSYLKPSLALLASSFIFAGLDAGMYLFGYGGGLAPALTMGVVTFGLALPLAIAGLYLRAKESKNLHNRAELSLEHDRLIYKELLEFDLATTKKIEHSLNPELTDVQVKKIMQYLLGLKQRLARFDGLSNDDEVLKIFKEKTIEPFSEARNLLNCHIVAIEASLENIYITKNERAHFDRLKVEVDSQWAMAHRHLKTHQDLGAPEETWLNHLWKYALPFAMGVGLVATSMAMLGIAALLAVPWIGLPVLLGIGLFAYSYKKSEERYAEAASNVEKMKMTVDGHVDALKEASKCHLDLFPTSTQAIFATAHIPPPSPSVSSPSRTPELELTPASSPTSMNSELSYNEEEDEGESVGLRSLR